MVKTRTPAFRDILSRRRCRKTPNVAAVEIVLNIARIVVIEDVEDGPAGAQVEFLVPYVRREWSCNLKVSRLETREALRTTRTDVIAILILDRVRKPGVHVVDGQDCQLPRALDVRPEQNPVRSVEGQAAFLIRLNDCLRVVADEQKWVVEVSVCPRMHVRPIQSGARKFVPSRDLEFPVGIAACIRHRDDSRLRFSG